MKSCYEGFVGILFFLSMLHTCMLFVWEASLGANIVGWLIVAVLFLIGRIFGMFKLRTKKPTRQMNTLENNIAGISLSPIIPMNLERTSLSPELFIAKIGRENGRL